MLPHLSHAQRPRLPPLSMCRRCHCCRCLVCQPAGVAVLTGRVTLPPCAQLLPTDLIIRPESVGICGSDFSYYCKCQIGGMDITFPDVHSTRFGGILGHECAGTVVSVGSAVSDRFAVGDRVAIEPGTP